MKHWVQLQAVSLLRYVQGKSVSLLEAQYLPYQVKSGPSLWYVLILNEGNRAGLGPSAPDPRED